MEQHSIKCYLTSLVHSEFKNLTFLYSEAELTDWVHENAKRICWIEWSSL